MGSLAPGPGFDLRLAQHLAESISKVKLELVNITRGLSLLEGENAKLSEWAMRIKDFLSNLSLRMKWLQFDQASGITSASISGVKLPKLEVPTFDGITMNWATFWGRFNVLIYLKQCRAAL